MSPSEVHVASVVTTPESQEWPVAGMDSVFVRPHVEHV